MHRNGPYIFVDSGKHNSTRVDEGRKSYNLLTKKNAKARTVGGRVEEEPANSYSM